MIKEDLLDIRRIATKTIHNKEWSVIIITASVVNTYLEFNSQYGMDDERKLLEFDIYDLDYINQDVEKNDVTNFLQKLRDDVYAKNPDRGAFYSVRVEIRKDTESVFFVDYDVKPVFEGDVPDEWFAKDLKMYPRGTKYVPEWLIAIT